MKNRKRKEKVLGIIILLLLVVGVTVGYSTLSKQFKINGTSTINNTEWDLRFENIANKDTTIPNKDVTVEPRLKDGSNDLELEYNVKLTIPGDYYEFTVDIANKGGIDAKLSSLPTLTGIDDTNKNFVSYTVTYADDKEIAVGDEILSGNSQTYKVRVEFLKEIENEDLPTTAVELNLGATFDYEQK